MKKILKRLSFVCLLLCLSACSENTSKKWQLDNPDLTQEERASLQEAIYKRNEVEARNSWLGLNGEQWGYFLLYFPELAKKCDELNSWHKLRSEDWVRLIAEDIRYHKKFEYQYRNNHNPFSLLKSKDWVVLINAHPQFEEDLEKSFMMENFNMWDWKVFLLSGNENLINKCYTYNGFKSFDVKTWVELLGKDTKYSENFYKAMDFARLEPFYLEKLFAIDDSFVIKAVDLGVFSKVNLSSVLKVMQENPDRLRVLFENINWVDFLKGDNTLASRKKRFLEILKANPILLEKCPKSYLSSLDSASWAALLSAKGTHISIANNYVQWGKLSAKNWIDFLLLGDVYVNKFIELKAWKPWGYHAKKGLADIVKAMPDSKELEAISLMLNRTKEEWFELAKKDPTQFEIFAENYELGIKEPVFEKGEWKYPSSGSAYKIRSDEWKTLILANPKISNLYADKYKIWEIGLTFGDKLEIATKHNEFEAKFREQKTLSEIGESMWNKVLIALPSMSDLYEKSKRNNSAWIQALKADYAKENADFIAFRAYRKFDSGQLAALIKIQPEILQYYENEDFLLKLCRKESYKNFHILGSALYFHIKENSDKRAFSMLEKIVNYNLANTKFKSSTAMPLTGNLITDLAIMEEQFAREMLDDITRRYEHQTEDYVCIYYLARCYYEGYCVEKDEAKSNSYYTILNKIVSGKTDLKNGEINEAWEHTYTQY